MNDELRKQLGRLDPMPPDVPVESVTTPSSRARLEQIMNTTLQEYSAPTRQPRQRRPWILAAAAAAAVTVGVIGVSLVENKNEGGKHVAATAPLDLSVPGAGPSMGSCIRFDVAILADMTTAFAGTATAVDDQTVTLTVDHWYKGGEAATVALHGSSSGGMTQIGAFPFEVGHQYLVSATDGNVNFCGYSGDASDELTAAYQQAFGA